MKIFILVCLALVATQVSAAPTEENLPTATIDDAAKQLTTSAEPKATDVEAPTPAATPEPTPIATPERTLLPPPVPTPTSAATPEPASEKPDEKELVQVKGEEKNEGKKEAENTAEKKGDDKAEKEAAEKSSDESKTESEKAEKSSKSSQLSVLQSLFDFFCGRPSDRTVEIEISIQPSASSVDDDDFEEDDIFEVIMPIESEPAESAPSSFLGLSRLLSSLPSWLGYHNSGIVA